MAGCPDSELASVCLSDCLPACLHATSIMNSSVHIAHRNSPCPCTILLSEADTHLAAAGTHIVSPHHHTEKQRNLNSLTLCIAGSASYPSRRHQQGGHHQAHDDVRHVGCLLLRHCHLLHTRLRRLLVRPCACCCLSRPCIPICRPACMSMKLCNGPDTLGPLSIRAILPHKNPVCHMRMSYIKSVPPQSCGRKVQC